MKRSTVTLLIVLVVLAIATYFVLRRPGEQSSTGFSSQVLVDYDSSTVDKIEIRSATGTTMVEKQEGTWFVTSPIHFRADSNAVVAILSQGKRIELKDLVSSNPEKQRVFQVDSTGLLIRISEKDMSRAAFRVGKTSSSFTETYVRRENSTEVYLANGFLSGTFNRQLKDLRDRTVFRVDVNSIKEVKFQYGDTTFTLQLRDTVWQIGNERASDATVRTFLSSLSNLQADDFIDSAMTLSRPIASFEVLGVQIRYYYETKIGRYLIQTSESSQWYTNQSWRALQILKRKKDFLQPAS
jgi:hypothetical protein